MNSYILLASLQRFLDRRGVALDQLTARSMLTLMSDWYLEVPIDGVDPASSADVLVYRYGGWSEGCATGFKLSLLRRVTETKLKGESTDWFAGITMMFDPSRYTEMVPFSTTTSDWQSVDAFMRAIESSPAFKLSASATPMGALMESGGVR